MAGFFYGMWLPEPAHVRSISDVEMGSYWKSVDNGSIWKVVYKDEYIHVSKCGEVARWGVNLFFNSFKAIEFGTRCNMCKKEFEYAEKVIGFRCWACRNGV